MESQSSVKSGIWKGFLGSMAGGPGEEEEGLSALGRLIEHRGQQIFSVKGRVVDVVSSWITGVCHNSSILPS